jgi:hypothetical protein
MKMDLTFNDVCNFIKSDSPEVLEDMNKLTSLILILSPLVVPPPFNAIGPTVGLLADWLSVKNEVAGIGKRILEKISEKEDNDSLSRLRRMEAAYCLICYTAFFEAIEQLFPELTASANLKATEKVKLSQSAMERIKAAEGQAAVDLSEVSSLNFRLPLPHPVDGLDGPRKHLLPLYTELTKGFLAFLECLAVWEAINETERGRLRQKATTSLPELSIGFFEAQYFLLADKYDEFYIWSNLKEHEETRNYLRNLSNYIREQAAATESGRNAIDVGFRALGEAVRLVPDSIEARRFNTVIQELERLYTNRVEEPVINDTSSVEDGKPSLTYPKKSEIYIPQSFKVIRYTGKEQLENENTWSDIPVRTDLGAFLLEYLKSPYSAFSPLIVLGHPGSGKSLLTNVIAARLISPLMSPIRVELRGINADKELANQIEEQIYKDTNREVSWATLSDHFREQPGLVLLDGYDELLQASGKVFSGYLLKVQQFQANEVNLGRKPVRTVVTSRITLIDKAEIPRGTTIIRLLEFEEEKRNAWIKVWNEANQQYFQQARVRPFELPQADPKTIALAEQPLLLLMLALYDSENNAIRRMGGIAQTVLYDSLLRRFVDRERMKDDDFKALKSSERKQEIDKDMERLGVAAIGMFNRRTLHIRVSELNQDITFFKTEREVKETGGRILSQADLLLGSFFFVHESTSVHKDSASQVRDVDAAFEFLHNTFGEFLTADFILREVLNQTDTIFALRSNDTLRTVLDQRLADSNGALTKWVACLMYTPLFSRPVILEMIREWLKQTMRDKARPQIEFFKDLDTIISSQIERIISGNTFTALMTESGKTPFGSLPLLGHVAIYSLNLILLQTVLSPDGYIFDEDRFPSYDDGTPPWDRLAHLWRSWFSLDTLNGLTAVFTATREGKKIKLTAKETFSLSGVTRLDSILNIGRTLADDVTVGLSGLLSFDAFQDDFSDLEDIGSRLNAEGIDLQAEYLTKRIRCMPVPGNDDLRHRQLYLLAREAVFQPQANTEAIISLIDEYSSKAKSTDDMMYASELFDLFARRINIGEWPPELIHRTIALAYEVGELSFLQYMYRENRRIIDGSYRDMALPINLLLDFINLARDFGEVEELGRLYDVCKYHVSVDDVHLDLLVETTKLANYFNDEEGIELVANVWLNQIHHLGRRWIEGLSLKYGPELLKAARRTGDERLADYIMGELISSMRWFSFEHAYMPPAYALEALKLTRIFGSQGWRMRLAETIFFRSRDVKYWSMARDEFGGQLLSELIALAREMGHTAELEYMYHEILKPRRIEADDLPLSSVENIRWLAEEFNDQALLKEINKRTRRTRSTNRRKQQE